MVGNDIIDIVEAQKSSNWQRPRFLDKLFTHKEQHIILNSDNSFLMVWKLWSMKEAAYKLYTQLHPSRFYNPKGFECSDEEYFRVVRFQNFRCYVKSRITSQYIISEARLKFSELDSEYNVLSDFSKIKSRQIKVALLSKIATHFKISKQDLNVVKTTFGVPLVYQNSKKLPVKISISHHGNYGAYAISYS
ncbi:4'-phosphopantetheinyl transferase superfamily protein [uncultured Winogradskyella sp.]|uniref:4'-phosphopantetheinyl transferase family protein n=1 Tax=uncultured Winogradskyella sp. TaxID=395353 RepID=UPI002608188F|nr:4'-phosphopantetheinyl transferase superfamily protein [uncultured Winogradskyella sp.]